MNSLENSSSWMDRLPPRAKIAIIPFLSFVAGLAVALLFHYLLYRVGLPSKPFIYVAF